MVAAHVQTVGGANAATVNLTMAAYTAGSRLVAAGSVRSGHLSRSGWTHLGDLTEPTTGDTLCVIWHASSGEPNNPLPISGSASAGRVWCSEFSGVDDPIQSATSNTTTSTGSDTCTITGVAAGSALFLAVMGCAADAWAGGGWTQSAGWTEVEDSSGGGHPYSNGAYQIAGASGSYSATPVHGNNWSGWFPKGEAMRIVELPVSGGGGGSTARSSIINMAKRRLWVIERPPLWVPGRA